MKSGAGLRLAVATGALCIASAAALLLTSAREAGGSSSAPRPNIVLVLTDDQTYESLATMSYIRGRSDWVRFKRAFVNNPLCCPSRVSILTGKYSHHSKVESNTEDPERFSAGSTIGTWLRGSGYRTGFIGKYLNGYPWEKGDGYIPPGWDRWMVELAGGFAYYWYRVNSDGQVHGYGNAPDDYSTDVYTDNAVEFIETSTPPFYLQVNYAAPHTPERAAPRHADLFQGTPVWKPPNFNERDVSDKPRHIRRRPLQDEAKMLEQRRTDYRQLASVDESVKRLFDALQGAGELDDTIVVYTSDHGVAWGEHRLSGKRCPYDECLRVPLLIRYPGRVGGVEAALVSNIDLAPTFASWAGIDPPPMDGRSLAPVIDNRANRTRRAVLIRNRSDGDDFNDYPTFWGVRTARFKLVTYPGRRERELYAIRRDPYELTNLAGRQRYRRVQARLVKLLKHLRRANPR